MTPSAWWLLAAFVISTYTNIWLLNERMKLMDLLAKASRLINHLHEERRGLLARGSKVPATFN